jgi:ATP-dependent DNA helicase RecG
VDIVELLTRPEGKTLEHKRDLSSPEGAMKALVAFANTSGGILAVGIENRTRRVLGIKDVLTVEERLTNLVVDTIRPRLVPDIEIVPWRKTHIIIAEVHPSAARPHYLVRLGPDEGVFVRVGSTNRRADAAQLQEMRRYAGFGSFDEQPIPELNSEAWTSELLPSCFSLCASSRLRLFAT